MIDRWRKRFYLSLSRADFRTFQCRRDRIFPIRDLKKRAAYSRGRGLFSERDHSALSQPRLRAIEFSFDRKTYYVVIIDLPTYTQGHTNISWTIDPRGDFRQRPLKRERFDTGGFPIYGENRMKQHAAKLQRGY